MNRFERLVWPMCTHVILLYYSGFLRRTSHRVADALAEVICQQPRLSGLVGIGVTVDRQKLRMADLLAGRRVAAMLKRKSEVVALGSALRQQRQILGKDILSFAVAAAMPVATCFRVKLLNVRIVSQQAESDRKFRERRFGSTSASATMRSRDLASISVGAEQKRASSGTLTKWCRALSAVRWL